MADRPDVLIVSGLDPSGGAGFIADTRVVHELGGRPCGVISAQTIQDTHGVRDIQPVDAELFDGQLAALLADVVIKSVKIGMLASLEAVRILDDQLAATNAPVVWDPVFAPSQGTIAIDPVLLRDALVKIGRHATLITPNLRELALLSGATTLFATFGEALTAAQKLASMIECAVLVKGGHAHDGTAKQVFVDIGDSSFDLQAESIDVLVTTSDLDVIRGVRHGATEGSGVHGTGCALSSAIATLLARGSTLSTACREAKQFVAARIASPVRAGRGAPSVL
ncbi:hydroxymethylpyrimidine/phosphomethylpyrimidine kinase [soil metagenome]